MHQVRRPQPRFPLTRHRRWWALASAFACAVLAAALLPAAPGGAQVPFREVQRVGTGDVLSTAISISNMLFDDGAAQTVVLARRDKFPDGLGATAVAARFNGPLLYTGGDSLDPATQSEIQRVLPAGANVYLMGGTEAISSAVEQQVDLLGYATPRFGGATRIETAALAARAVGAGPSGTALVLRSHGDPDNTQGWVDSVSCGGYAANTVTPILLTNPADPGLHPATTSTLQTLGISRVVICGGQSAVPQGHADQLAGMGIAIERRAGLDRVETAVDVARGLWDAGRPDGRTFVLVPGWGSAFGYGLAGAALSAAFEAPMLLVGATEPTQCSGQQPSRTTLCYLLTNGDPILGLVAVGSPLVISDEVVAAAAAAGGLTPDTTPPPAPTGLVAEDVPDDDGTEIALAWDAVADPEGGDVAYTIYARASDGAAFSKENASTIGTTAQTDAVVSSVQPGVAYEFAVTSVDAVGNESPLSAVVPVTSVDDVPGAPTSPPSLSNVEPFYIRVSWVGAPEQDAAGYIVQRAPPALLSGCDPGLLPLDYQDVAAVADPTVLSVVDDTVTQGAQYCYRYLVVDTTGNRGAPSPANGLSAAPPSG